MFEDFDFKDIAERAATAAVIAAIVAYETGARNFSVLGGAALGAALSVVKNAVKQKKEASAE